MNYIIGAYIAGILCYGSIFPAMAAYTNTVEGKNVFKAYYLAWFLCAFFWPVVLVAIIINLIFEKGNEKWN